MNHLTLWANVFYLLGSVTLGVGAVLNIVKVLHGG